MTEDSDEEPVKWLSTRMWDFTNDMRDIYNSRKMSNAAKVEAFDNLRAELEAELAEREGRPLPDGHKMEGNNE